MSGATPAVHITQFPGNIITVAAASASCAIPTDAAGLQPKYCRLSVTTSCYVRLGKGAQTAVAGDMMLNIGAPQIAQCTGFDTVAAIQVTAGGILQVSAVENY